MIEYQIQFKADKRWVLWASFDNEDEAKDVYVKRINPRRPWRLVKVITEVLEEKGGT